MKEPITEIQDIARRLAALDSSDDRLYDAVRRLDPGVARALKQVEFSGYMVSMERLFERFLLGAVARAFSGVTKQSRRDAWADGDTRYLPSIMPDIVIRDRLIIDAKYYRGVLAENGKVRSAHIYQMHTYMQALDLDGVLVYPLSEDEAAQLPLRFGLPGGRTLWVAAIDLARDARPEILAAPLVRFLRGICNGPVRQVA